MKLRKQMLAVALAVSMAVSCPGAPGIQVTSVKAEEQQTGREGQEEAIKVTDMTIAPTYYNVGDKFPLYMEFQTEKALTSTEKEKLSKWVLTVKDKDNVVAVVTGASINDSNGQCCFQTSEENEYANVASGEKRSLDFIITDASSKQVGEVTSKAVSFQNKSVWSDRKYLDTGRDYYNIGTLKFVLPVTDDKELEAVYLVNQQGKVVAGTEDDIYFSSGSDEDERYGGIFTNVPLTSGKLYRVSGAFYRSRKIEAGNLQIKVRFKDGETYSIKEDVFQVTEAPYISSVDVASTDLFAGEDAFIVNVSGNHIDFTKLSLVLKEKRTGNIVGRSVSSVTTSQQKQAFYTIRWEEGYQPVNYGFYYDVEFQYPETVIAEDDAKEVDYRDDSSPRFEWNPRTDSIEIYSKKISGQVSYEVRKSSSDDSDVLKSGTVDVDDSHHAVVPLEGACKVSGRYRLFVTCKRDNGKIEMWSDIYIYVDGSISGESGYSIQSASSYLSNYFYLSNQTEFLFTAGLYCNDESKLSEECSAVIRNKNTGAELGTVSLTKQKRSGNSQYYSYSGSYRGNLGAGGYTLSFQPDKETELTYDFYVLDSSKLCVASQSTDQDRIDLHFGSSDVAKWYCSEENQKKLSVQVFDIEKNKIAEYPLSGTEGFTVSGDANDSSSRTLVFSEKMKEDLKDYYYYNIYVYYNGEHAVSAYDLSRSLYEYYRYEYYRYEGRYLRSDEMENGYISLSGNYDRGKYEYTYIDGTAGTFPVKITIMDWYRLDFSNPVATITVDGPGSLEGKLSGLGLSGKKLYAFCLEGQNGTYDREIGYAPVEGGSNIQDTGGGGGTMSVVPSVPPVSDSNADKKEEEQQEEEQPEEQTPEEQTPEEQTPEEQTPVTPGDSGQEEQTPSENNSGTVTESKKKSKGKLTLKKKKLVLKKGQKSKIKITSKLNTGVTYRSLDTSIAKVNKNGVVTGKKKGKTTIVVKANGKKKKVKVTIKAVKAAKDSSVITLSKKFKLSEKKTTLKKGTKLTIQKASGMGKVTFRSLNKKIASVSVKGVVKARSKGKTTIVIKKGKKTIKLKVTVKR